MGAWSGSLAGVRSARRQGAVNDGASLAIVCTDGRYPAERDGYHLNEYITETEEVLWGAAVVEFLQPREIKVVQVGDLIALRPGRPYSISGKCVSLIHMHPSWVATQKRFVLADYPESGQRKVI